MATCSKNPHHISHVLQDQCVHHKKTTALTKVENVHKLLLLVIFVQYVQEYIDLEMMYGSQT